MARIDNSIFEKLSTPPWLTSYIKQLVSTSTRKKIKSYLGKIFTPAHEIISQELLKQLSQNQSKDILIFSVISWESRFQRPQQLATQLSRLGYRVFYIEHEFLSHFNPFSRFAPIQINQISSNLYNVYLSATRELFIYDEVASLSDQKILVSSLKNLIFKANICNPIAIIDHPFWVQILKALAMPVIYDCMDQHHGFRDNSPHISVLEKQLFTQSDITLVTSKNLFQHASQNYAQNISLIPNAGDYEHFASTNQQLPTDIATIPHPIIGYYGAISDWFDTKIIASLANKHPEYSIVLIGMVTNPSINKLAAQYSNIHLLGEKSYSELPSYLHQFDVCTIPFILNDLIKATHPVKIFEYLAAGKPVVSTKLPEILGLPQVLFANSADFVSVVSHALVIKDQHIKDRQQVAQKNTWVMRADQLDKQISKLLYPKVSVIILSYNSPDLIKQTLDSVLSQSHYPNLEIIVVDNNSNTATIKLLKKYPQIKLILNATNTGFAKGNNIGLKAATGDYLILLNNDVVVTPGWVSRLLFHVKKPDVGLVGPVTNNIGNEAKVDATLENYQQYTSSHWGQTLSVNNIAAFCWIMSRRTYNQIGTLDEQYGRGMFEDDDYCHRVKSAGLNILIADDVFIHHYGGASFKKISSPEYQQIFKENKLKFENKWHIKWTPHQYRK